ncbi:MAG TPA: hypothetical protein VM118_15095 [Acidobacteriota bacterium]|nr:hypothetical protein [Acidobacteriota bacterium]
MRRLLRCGALGLALLALGCSSERSANGDIDEPTGMYIDEPIVLAYSDSLEPDKPPNYYMWTQASSKYLLPGKLSTNEYIFDFSDVPLVTQGRCNDFLISYRSMCHDLNLEVWDNERRTWRKLGFRSPICDLIWSHVEHSHMFSVAGVTGQAALNGDLQVRVRFGWVVPPPKIWVLEINPEFEIIPDFPEIRYERRALAFAGDGFYYASACISPDDRFATGMYHTNWSGETRSLFCVPQSAPDYPWITGVACDAEHLWTVLSNGDVRKTDEQGEIICSFETPTGHGGRVTWDGTGLWLTGYTEGNLYLMNIDPEASCEAGQAVITRMIPMPGEGCCGIAWDGSHILLAADSLYRIAPTGEVTQTYDIPLVDVDGVAWDGSRVCILSHGPPGPGGRTINEMPIACFRLR